MRLVLDTHLRILDATPEQFDALCRRCTFENPKFEQSKRYTRTGQPGRGIERKIVLWEDLPDELAIPRGLVSEVWSAHPDAAFEDLTVRPIADLGTSGALVPRDYQVAAVEAVIRARGGVVVAPTGTGKTVIALHLAERLRTPTLILEHTGVLLAQTADRIRSLLGVEPGIIGDGVWKPDPITVATVQTLSVRGAGELRDYFGLVVQDEAHHVPATTFARVMQMFAARYRVGLTATPHRADGLDPILFAVIGPVVYQLRATALPLQFVKVETGFRCEKLPERKTPPWLRRKFELNGEAEPKPQTDHTELVNLLCRDPERNQLVLDTVQRYHAGASLVLSDRVAHVRVLAEQLRARGLRAVALAGEVRRVGKKVTRKQVDDREREDAVSGIGDGRYDVLVSTPGMVGEGFDCPRIDTVFLVTPTADPSKTEQLAGRTTRPFDGKAYGRVIDFVDESVKPLAGQWWRRYRVYKRLGETTSERRSA